MVFTGTVAGRPATVEAKNAESAVEQLKWFNNEYFSFRVELTDGDKYGIKVDGYEIPSA